jgi:membrane protease YdiL (CAAX protease family)
MSTLTVSPKATRAVSVRNLLVSHPFIAFFVLAFAGTWLFFAPIVLGQDGLGFLPYHVPLWLYVVLFLAASFSGPTTAALVITAARDGKAGVKQFLRRYGQWRVGWQWYLIPLVGFPALYLIPATFWLGAAPWQALIDQWPTFFTVYLMAVLIFPALINWGEEAGFRGFAQTHMQKAYGALTASLVVGLLHSLWHLPVFLLVHGPPALGPFDLGEFLMNTLMTLLLTVIYTWIFNGAQQSILIAALMHASLNGTQAWVGTLIPNLPQAVDNTFAISLAVGALLLIVLTRGRLGYRPEETTPS